MLVQLLILLLSTISMAGVAAMLRTPGLPRVLAPAVIYSALDEGYHDTRGLV